MPQDSASTTTNAGQVGWRIPQWCQAVGLKRSTCYNLLVAGKIEAVKAGSAIIVVTQPDQYLASLPKAVLRRAA